MCEGGREGGRGGWGRLRAVDAGVAGCWCELREGLLVVWRPPVVRRDENRQAAWRSSQHAARSTSPVKMEQQQQAVQLRAPEQLCHCTVGGTPAGAFAGTSDNNRQQQHHTTDCGSSSSTSEGRAAATAFAHSHCSSS